MSKRMTVIFEDEALYTALKIEAVRKGRHAKDIVAEAVREWLEAREDEELGADLEERRTEWKEKGYGRQNRLRTLARGPVISGTIVPHGTGFAIR